MKVRVLISLLTLLGTCVFVSAEALRVGRAAVKITPEVGTPMGSSYGIRISEGVHDDLYAKAMVLEVDGVKTALVACDLISIRRPIVEAARRLIEQKTSLRGEDVIISATHCHAGPQMHPLFLKQVEDRYRRLGEAYVAKLPDLITESVQRAEADLTSARAFAGTIREESISFNRRFLLKDGSVKMNPGRGNPDIMRSVGPIDPQISVLYFESMGAQPLVTLVNFALHVAVVGGTKFSADFPHVLARLLGQVKGPEMLTIFTNGTSGNINHIDVRWKDQPSGLAEATRLGIILAANVAKTYSALQPLKPAPLRVRTDKVELPVPAVSADSLERADEVMSRYGTPESAAFFDVVRAWKTIDQAELKGGPLETEVQVITLGDQVAVVGFPGDAFVELGLSIKLNSPFPYTIVSEQSGNGAISYVPNRKAFPEGGYEVISARFLPGGGERLAEAAVRLLIDLFPGAGERR